MLTTPPGFGSFLSDAEPCGGQKPRNLNRQSGVLIFGGLGGDF